MLCLSVFGSIFQAFKRIQVEMCDKKTQRETVVVVFMITYS